MKVTNNCDERSHGATAETKFQMKENDMSKMRSDCVFSKLTPEQADLLEGWLFEENMSYKDALERAQKEFGIGGSLTGLRRFYGRLAKERGRESLTEGMSMCVEAAALGDNAVLRAGLLTMANMCAVQFMTESPRDIKTITALLRALTSAQAQELKRVKSQSEDDRIREGDKELALRRLVQQRGRVLFEEIRQRNAEENEEREKMNEEKEAREAAKEGTDMRVNATSPRPSPPKAERGSEVAGFIPALENSRVSSGGPPVAPLKAA
jgi:hypothetical protein